MSKQNLKKSITVILGISLFVLVPALARANGLIDISFEYEPLFDEADFKPGDIVTHWVEVTNKSSESQPIGVEVIDYSSCSQNCLSDQLRLEINDGGPNLYEASLTDFFGAGEIKLSDLGAGNNIKYYFTITFPSGAGNEYQNSGVSFDFNIGAIGKAAISGEIPGGGGPMGGSSGLIISDEDASAIPLGQATITWLTNKPANSRVIYSMEGEPHTLQLDNLPDYGYAHSTGENPALVTSHSVTITGLDPGVTYYYRCVSHGSFAVSVEHSFTALGVKRGEGREEGVLGEGIIGEIPPVPPGLGEEIPGGEEVPAEGKIEEEGGKEEPEEEVGMNKLLSAIGYFFRSGNLCWLLFLLIVILTILFLLSLKKKIKDEGKKKRWILPLVGIVILIISYSLICPYYWILVIIEIVLFILSLLIYYSEKKKLK